MCHSDINKFTFNSFKGNGIALWYSILIYFLTNIKEANMMQELKATIFGLWFSLKLIAWLVNSSYNIDEQYKTSNMLSF